NTFGPNIGLSLRHPAISFSLGSMISAGPRTNFGGRVVFVPNQRGTTARGASLSQLTDYRHPLNSTCCYRARDRRQRALWLAKVMRSAFRIPATECDALRMGGDID